MSKPFRDDVLTGRYQIYCIGQHRINYGTVTADVEIISDREIVIKQPHENIPACNSAYRSRDGGFRVNSHTFRPQEWPFYCLFLNSALQLESQVILSSASES